MTRPQPEPTPAAPTPIHGLPLGELPVTPPSQEADAVLDRMAFWESSLKPFDPVEVNLTQTIARESLRAERIHQQEIILRQADADRAASAWDEHRRDDAETLAARLSRHPALVMAKLRRFRHGCELLAERWESLRDTVKATGKWTAAQRRLALILLNIPPELRDAVGPLDVPPDTDPATHLASLADTQARRHRDLATALTRVDHLEKQAVIHGLGPDTPAQSTLRAQERASDRRLALARSLFKKHRDHQPPVIDRGDLPAYLPDEHAAFLAQRYPNGIDPMISRRKAPPTANPNDPPPPKPKRSRRA